jgi:formaldehyde-activating enzyme involved in methanogenesis
MSKFRVVISGRTKIKRLHNPRQRRRVYKTNKELIDVACTRAIQRYDERDSVIKRAMKKSIGRRRLDKFLNRQRKEIVS